MHVTAVGFVVAAACIIAVFIKFLIICLTVIRIYWLHTGCTDNSCDD